MSEFEGKNIAILGGTGTVGRAIIQYLLSNLIPVGKIIIYSRDEIKQLEMMDEYSQHESMRLEYRIGDVRDLERLEEVLEDVDFVIHAAALKHVVMAENNPSECWKTNVEGTKNVIESCIRNQVDKSLLISTDKAINPIGVYGKSKLEAENNFLNVNSTGTEFHVIRLGNIIGARGSVFEAFERQKKTGVIKVTHPEATRFCISKERAAEHILDMFRENAPTISTPQMDSFNVLDLAKQVGPECKIEIVGLRPGDKLHEEIEGIYSNDKITF